MNEIILIIVLSLGGIAMLLGIYKLIYQIKKDRELPYRNVSGQIVIDLINGTSRVEIFIDGQKYIYPHNKEVE